MSDPSVQNGCVRALIVDDNAGFRRELRNLLELEQIAVVGEAGNGWEAVELTQQMGPDVVLMDQNMPALSGIDATRRIKQAAPDQRVLFLAAEEAWRQEAMRAGAEAYFVKGNGCDQLIQAILHPGLSAAQPQQSPKRRRVILRGAALALAGLALLALATSTIPIPISTEWFPAIALMLAPLSLALYLLGGE